MYKSIKKVNDKLSKNAATISTTQGGRNHRYLAITVSPTIYATLSPTAFTPPTVPAPPDLSGMTSPQILAANHAYDKAKCKQKEYLLLQNGLKRLLINAVEKIYLKAIAQPYVGHGNRSLWELLKHLYTTYARYLSHQPREGLSTHENRV